MGQPYAGGCGIVSSCCVVGLLWHARVVNMY